MTTILVDMNNKTLYSDSRMTQEWTENGIPRMTFFQNSMKLIASSKFIVARAGNVRITDKILSDFDIQTDTTSSFNLFSDRGLHYQSGTILFLNKYNKSAFIIERKYNLSNKPKEKRFWISNCNFISFGSGGYIAGEIFKRTGNPIKAMNIAGLVDKFSDTNIHKLQF